MQYLIESSICLALLYGFYHVLLRRESFFQFNRGYLLLAPLLAFAVPAMNIRLVQEAPVGETSPAVSPAVDATWPAVVEQMQVAPRLIGRTLEMPVWELSLGTVLWWIYGCVGILFLLRLGVQIYRLARFIRLCNRETQDGVVFAQSPSGGPVASFFGFVFWSPESMDEQDRRLIFEHEMVHVRQWHSLDLIFIELLIALQWFNPLLYVYRRSLREVHEYIADDYVVRRTRQRYQYAALMVRHNTTGNGAQPGLVNTFHSLIQKRLVMLAKLPSRPLRRARYLLALPLFAMLMLLFSFRMADKLPEVQKVAALLENYAATVSEITIVGDKPVERYEPRPYILYWGAFEAHLRYEEGQNAYVADLQLSPETLLEALQREPRLWTGETLDPKLSLEFNGIVTHSDYARPKVYQAVQPQLEALAKGLRQGDQLAITNILLPGGLKGRVSISIAKSTATPAPKPTVGNPEVVDIRWGGKTFVRGEMRFLTVTELWGMLNTEMSVQYTDGRKKQPTALNILLANEQGVVIRPRAERKDALTTDQLRERLTQAKASVKEGATLQFAAWDLQQSSLSVTTDTIITFDPVTYEETIQIVRNDGAITSDVSTDLFSVVLVDDFDPRRFLRAADLHNYAFQWGSFVQELPRSLYAQSYTVNGSGNRIYTDKGISMWNNRFTKKQLLQVLAEKAKLFQGEKPLGDFNFTLSYKGKGYLIEDGKLPADVLKKLTQELKAGETLSITGIQARENPVRHFVMPSDAVKNHPELRISNADAVEVMHVYRDQELTRLALPASEFHALRGQLEKVPDAWLQYGDIDLTKIIFELEVRDEDPKHELPVTKTKGGIFTVKLSVSPNPVAAQQATSVVIRVEEAGAGILALYNLEGKQLYAQKASVETGENRLELPADALPVAGVYIVRFDMPYGSGSTQLVVE